MTEEPREQMTEPFPEKPRGRERSGLVLTAGSALLVLLLAIGSVLWPAQRTPTHAGVLLVLDPVADSRRSEEIFAPLTEFLAEQSGIPLQLKLVRDLPGLRQAAVQGADFILCPDGAGLLLSPDRWQPLVTGRRAAPRNLRPRSVLVYRRAVGLQAEPWLSSPARTVLGDSLSLCGAGVVLQGQTPQGMACAFGPDPYDHGPVLHAARLGAFDFAVVRQWDAQRFQAAGLLPEEVWGVEPLGKPVPDLVLLSSTGFGTADRLKLGQALAALGRADGEGELSRLPAGLGQLHLVGFHVLLEPDWQGVRDRFPDFLVPAGAPANGPESHQDWHEPGD